MKIGIIQQRNSSDINANRQSLISKIKQLAGMGTQLVVLPELHDSLYFCQVESVDNFDLAVPIPGDVTRQYADVARECGIVLVTSLFEKRSTGPRKTRSTSTRSSSVCRWSGTGKKLPWAMPRKPGNNGRTKDEKPR